MEQILVKNSTQQEEEKKETPDRGRGWRKKNKEDEHQNDPSNEQS